MKNNNKSLKEGSCIHEPDANTPFSIRKHSDAASGSYYIAHVDNNNIQTIDEHSLSVASISGIFSKKVKLEHIGYMAGLLHDLGKYSSIFQRYISSAGGLISKTEPNYLDPVTNKGKIDHSTAGAKLCMCVSGEEIFDLLSKEFIAIAVMSHHSGLPDIWKPNHRSSFDGRLELNHKTKDVYNEIINSLPDLPTYVSDYIDTNCVSEIKSYLHNLKKTEERTENVRFRLGLMARFIMSSLVDADRLDTVAFMTKTPIAVQQRPDWKSVSKQVEQYVTKFDKKGSINKIREKVLEQCVKKGRGSKGTYTLSVPTGGGKTLSSFRFALEHAHFNSMDRIIYVAPFISIIDQNAKVIRDALGPKYNNLVLEYHSSVIHNEKSNDDVRTADDNWDMPIILTTMVQYLNTFFASGTSSARRMHNLANSVIIFDEVQSIPTRCIHSFNLSVNFLKEDCGVTSVLCTATQPDLDEMHKPIKLSDMSEIVPSEIYQDMPVRTKIIDKRTKFGWTYSDIANMAIEYFEKGKSVLIILNTKKCAENVSIEIDKTTTESYYLSTNLCPEHRIRTIEQISNSLASKISIICVSTQLVEAGVDLDFDVVIRSLAGFDSIIQASGRCNRNGHNSNPGDVIIVNPRGENIGSLMEIRTGNQIAGRILDEKSQSLSEYLTEYRKRYYKKLMEIKSNIFDYPLDVYESSMVKMLSDNIQAYRSESETPRRILNQSFRSVNSSFRAIEDNSIPLLVLNAGGKKIVDIIKSIAKKTGTVPYTKLRTAQKYTVNVNKNIFDKMLKSNSVEKIYNTEIWTYGGEYDMKYGFVWRIENER